MKRKVFLILGVVMFVVWVLSLCVTTGMGRFLDGRVSSHLTLARRAADAQEMYFHLTTLKYGMERWGMTQGYTAFVHYGDPRRDMAKTYQTVVLTEQRVEEILAIDTGDTAGLILRDTGLADIRKAVDKLEIDTRGHWIHNNPAGIVLFLLSTWGFLLAFGLLVVGGIKK